MSATKTSARFKVGDSVSFFYGPQRIRAKVLEDRGLLGKQGSRLYRVGFDAGQEDQTTVEMPEEDLKSIEETPSTSRQAFEVTYYRPAGTNTWTATTKWEGCRKDMKAKGAVVYTTGHWAGQLLQDENHGIVSVLVESRPQFDNEDLRNHPNVLRRMVDEAREMADAMLRARHAGAVIEHDDADFM